MDKRTYITLAQVMLPDQANPAGNVHGGEVMKFMDNVAGSLGRRYAKSNVVTARVDELQFHLPIKVGSFVVGKGIIAYVGKSSMEIIVTVEVENLESDQEPQKALSAFFTMVALDHDGKPKILPPLEPDTEEERALYDMAKARKANYKRITSVE